MDEGISLGLVMALVEEATGADPAVIEQAVQDWLDAHPEATTTVADGSITEQKLAAAVAAKINQVNQLSDEIDALTAATTTDIGKALSPKTVSNGKVTEWQYKTVGGGSGGGAVDDVQINGTSVVDGNGVANIPMASASTPGVVRSGTVAVSGTTPTITGQDGIRYVCGEVSTLDITLPASGIIDVVFESGSTATVLTITPPTGTTLKWANGFDPTALEANTTYEINIADGLGVACAWT